MHISEQTPRVAYTSEEITTSEATRSAKYKWVIVIDTAVPTGRATNAVACVAATTGALVEGLIARGGPDATGHFHPGLPWAGCSVLGGTAADLASAHAKATGSEGVLVVDMPAAAQTHRIYDGYLKELASTASSDLGLCAFSIIGPRNRVDKIVKKLTLLP